MADPRTDLEYFIVDDSAGISLLYSCQKPSALLAGSEELLPVEAIGEAGAAEGDSRLLEHLDIPFIEDAPKGRA